jgi:N12 class adenine-specific DNA methylase
MAKNESVRIPPAQLAQDREVYAAIKGNQRYAPANPDYTQAELDAAHTELEQSEHAAVQAEAAAAAARDVLVTSQWRFHNKMIGVKDQVVAQFGRNSNEAQAVGLKKPEEYKKPTRKTKKNGDK